MLVVRLARITHHSTSDAYIVWMFYFFKQKTAYEMRISDWSSDVCSSDLAPHRRASLLKKLRVNAELCTDGQVPAPPPRRAWPSELCASDCPEDRKSVV